MAGAAVGVAVMYFCDPHRGKARRAELEQKAAGAVRLGGRELAKKILAKRPATKVLYLSGYTEDAIVTQGALAPGTAFLQKPFTLQNLAKKVREVLRAPSQAKSASTSS